MGLGGHSGLLMRVTSYRKTLRAGRVAGPGLPLGREAALRLGLGAGQNPSLFQHQQHLSHHKNKLYQGRQKSLQRG